MLKRLLDSQDLKQEDAAQLDGLRLGFLSRLIRGRRVLETDLAEKLARSWRLLPEQSRNS